MQNKGAIRLVAILLLLACIWQLSFTAVTKIQENKAEKYAEQIAAQAVNDDECAMMSEAEKADYIAEVAKSSNRAYIDSLSAEKGIFSYKSAKAKEINLGLDLKGGMNVMLQVQLDGNGVVLVINDLHALAHGLRTQQMDDAVGHAAVGHAFHAEAVGGGGAGDGGENGVADADLALIRKDFNHKQTSFLGRIPVCAIIIAYISTSL